MASIAGYNRNWNHYFIMHLITSLVPRYDVVESEYYTNTGCICIVNEIKIAIPVPYKNGENALLNIHYREINFLLMC